MDVPLWLFVLVLAWAALATLLWLGKIQLPLPFPDPGSHTFACSSVTARDTLVALFSQYGLKPRFRPDSAKIKRVIFTDWTDLVYTSPDLYEQMGRPSAAKSIVVSEPVQAAERACTYLRAKGFTAEALPDFDINVPPGAMVMVKTDALLGSIIIFRKSAWHLGPPPPRWKIGS